MPEPVPGVENTSDSIEGEFASRLDTLEDKSLVFVSLGTPNSKELYETIDEILTDEFDVASIEYYEKAHFSRPLTDEDVENITSNDVDGIIEGFALCGSCNSSSSVDSIAFENQGIPTVQIISEDFIELNRKIADSYGYDELPLVAIPQSTKYADENEVKELCQKIRWSLRTMLTCEECLGGECSIDGETHAEATN
ncbi:UGSC family (seleno)protein [Natronorubrum sp. FCH18a]|uniref:UGSC family (seleno)protein n=1 Tax=Natronorubrum sp. FCH18a TaxID=3447018 RepID=UPI003F50E642